jgi:iron complex transport system substrate-binding protein
MDGSRVTVTRIVSLLPSATEIVYALGLGERLVGVTHECDFPPDARAKPHLTASALPHAGSSAEIDRHVRASLHAGSSLYALDAELLERLAPDLIVTQELCEVCAVSYEIVARAAKRLRGDPRLVSLEPSSLDDVYANVATIGALTGTEAEAERLVAALRSRAARLAAHVAGRARPRTLVLEWSDPPMSGGHWTPELVELAGGEPVLANPGANSRVLAWDEIAAADPDVILVAPCGFDLDAALRAAADLARVPAWTALRAVRAGRAYAIDGNAYVNRPGPRLVDSAEIFASAIAGERYGAGADDPRAFAPLGAPEPAPSEREALPRTTGSPP